MGLLGGIDHMVEQFQAPMTAITTALHDLLVEIRMMRAALERMTAALDGDDS